MFDIVCSGFRCLQHFSVSKSRKLISLKIARSLQRKCLGRKDSNDFQREKERSENELFLLNLLFALDYMKLSPINHCSYRLRGVNFKIAIVF